MPLNLLNLNAKVERIPTTTKKQLIESLMNYKPDCKIDLRKPFC